MLSPLSSTWPSLSPLSLSVQTDKPLHTSTLTESISLRSKQKSITFPRTSQAEFSLATQSRKIVIKLNRKFSDHTEIFSSDVELDADEVASLPRCWGCSSRYARRAIVLQISENSSSNRYHAIGAVTAAESVRSRDPYIVTMVSE
jgi:hypothetical protein